MSAVPYPLLFITSNLGGGGAERALVNILNHLDRTRFQPHLALFQKEGVFLRELASDVPVYEIQPSDRGFLHRNWMRIRAIRQLCDRLRPALVMSILWQANIVTLLTDAIFGLGCPLVVNEQNTPSEEMQSLWQRFFFWPIAHQTYHRAVKVVTSSSGIASEVREIFSLPEAKVCVIHNPVSLDAIRNKSMLPLPITMHHPCLISVGRLSQQKNHGLLLRAMRKVVEKNTIHLYILGEGPNRPRLERLAQALGLDALVHFLGFKSNPFVFMRSADAFVLSSDFEGFGNVIVEAMVLGVPVISTDCPNGPREILADGKHGVLVPVRDEDALAYAISELVLGTPEKRQYFSAEGRKRADDFAIENIVPIYERLFLHILEQDQV